LAQRGAFEKPLKPHGVWDQKRAAEILLLFLDLQVVHFKLLTLLTNKFLQIDDNLVLDLKAPRRVSDVDDQEKVRDEQRFDGGNAECWSHLPTPNRTVKSAGSPAIVIVKARSASTTSRRKPSFLLELPFLCRLRPTTGP